MTQELKDKWVAALRSGKYKQGQGQLKKQLNSGDICYCCLGVLADLQDPDGFTRDGSCWNGNRVPPGLTTKNATALISMNDHKKRSFAEIADFIEQQLVDEDGMLVWEA